MIGRSILAITLALLATAASAQTTGEVKGRVTDEPGGALPGVTVELRGAGGEPAVTVTDGEGSYTFSGVAPGTYQLAYSMINFGSVTHRDLAVTAGKTATN